MALIRCAFLMLCLLLAACHKDGPPVYPGYAEADTIRLAAPLAGTLSKLQLVKGSNIARDAPAYVLEQENERARREEAEFRVKQAQEQLVNLQRPRRPEELKAAQAQLAEAQAALALSTANLARGAKLVADKFASPASLDQLKADVSRDRAHVADMTAQLALAQQGARPNEIGAAQEALRASQAQLEQADWTLSQKTQKTPVAGLVTDILYREGEWVPVGGIIATLLPPQNIKARFFVPQPVLGSLALGQAVNLVCDGCKAAIAAKISFIATEAEYTAPLIYSKENRASLVFMVEALPAPADAPLLHPGQPLEVRLRAGAP